MLVLVMMRNRTILSPSTTVLNSKTPATPAACSPHPADMPPMGVRKEQEERKCGVGQSQAVWTMVQHER